MTPLTLQQLLDYLAQLQPRIKSVESSNDCVRIVHELRDVLVSTLSDARLEYDSDKARLAALNHDAIETITHLMPAMTPEETRLLEQNGRIAPVVSRVAADLAGATAHAAVISNLHDSASPRVP